MNATEVRQRTRASMGNASGYRPDIDGLRSIAVVGVVLFHAGVSALPGGYVGVDVFFVISGYLITRQVVAGVQRSRFSFAEFYLRRARRLLPAALFTIVGTLVAAFILLPPFRIAEIAQSAASAAVSVSNFFFWQESGYWAEASANQPLLHTWSLSVEEQFYLVWPLAVLLLVTFLPRLVVPVMVVGAILSVAVTTYVSMRSPDAAFYLMPFRAYEFAIGALCVWAERVPWLASGGARAARSASWAVGLAMILFSMLTFDEDGTTFPGWLALVPTVGTALMILARRPAVLDGALSNPVMNYIGLRSYSIYLVHWPILVFTAELSGELTPMRAALCVIATVAVAELQYRLIERPLRIRGGHRGGVVALRARLRRFAKLAVPVLAAASVVCGVSLTAAWASARPEAYPEEVRAVVEMDHDAVNAERRIETNAQCATRQSHGVCGTFAEGEENIVVLGSSLTPEGFLFAKELFPEANFITSERAGCPPLIDLEGIDDAAAGCEKHNEERFKAIEAHTGDISVLVVAMRLVPARIEAVVDLAASFERQGIEVVVWGQGPHYAQSAWQTIAEHGEVSGAGEALFDDLDVDPSDNERFKTRITDTGAGYIDRWDWMCSENSCRSHLGHNITDLVMIDRAHMTRNAVIAFAKSVSADPATRRLFEHGSAPGRL